jgi:hypothetical protein
MPGQESYRGEGKPSKRNQTLPKIHSGALHHLRLRQLIFDFRHRNASRARDSTSELPIFDLFKNKVRCNERAQNSQNRRADHIGKIMGTDVHP